MRATAIHPAVGEAYGILATGTPIELPLATRLSELPGEDLLDLISLAHKVRLKYAPGLHACSIVNAKSGACPENCRFCAQSAHHAAQVPEYGLLEPAELLSRAEEVWRNGANRWSYWDAMDEAERTQAAVYVSRSVEKMPDELLYRMVKVVESEAKRRKVKG